MLVQDEMGLANTYIKICKVITNELSTKPQIENNVIHFLNSRS